jgi:DNA end-binding protein Ku
MSFRSVWSGAITFGVVGVNVKMYKGTSESEKIKFNQLHSGCGGRVGRKNYCKICGKEWSEGEGSSDICKGYEHIKGQYVVVTDDELSQIAIESNKQINIKNFVSADSLDVRMFEDFCYLRQDGKGNQLSLLKKAMEKKGIAQVSMRDKEHLVALRPMKDAFVLQIMRYPDEVKNPDIFEDQVVSEKELEMAGKLIDMMSDDIDLSTFKNKYNDALTSLVKSKIDGTVIVPSAVITTKTGAESTIDALERSIQALSKKETVFDPEDINKVAK